MKANNAHRNSQPLVLFPSEIEHFTVSTVFFFLFRETLDAERNEYSYLLSFSCLFAACLNLRIDDKISPSFQTSPP